MTTSSRDPVGPAAARRRCPRPHAQSCTLSLSPRLPLSPRSGLGHPQGGRGPASRAGVGGGNMAARTRGEEAGQPPSTRCVTRQLGLVSHQEAPSPLLGASSPLQRRLRPKSAGEGGAGAQSRLASPRWVSRPQSRDARAPGALCPAGLQCSAPGAAASRGNHLCHKQSPSTFLLALEVPAPKWGPSRMGTGGLAGSAGFCPGSFTPTSGCGFRPPFRASETPGPRGLSAGEPWALFPGHQRYPWEPGCSGQNLGRGRGERQGPGAHSPRTLSR